jgi:hypothetical protein
LWALYAFIVLIALIVVALSIPVDFVFKFDTSEFHLKHFRVRWLFGLFEFNLHKPSGKGKTVARLRKRARKRSPREILKILQVEGLFGQMRKLLANVFKSIRIKQLNADITIGLEDPVYCGYLFALAAPVNHLLGMTPYRVAINPVFEGQLILQLSAEGCVRAYPIRLLGAVLAFFFSAPAWKIMGMAVRRWK